MTRLPSTAALLAVLLAAAASAQTPGSCALGTAQGDLDVSDVFARVFNTGSLFFGNTTTDGSGYIVPRFSGHSPIFAAGLWVGGTVDGEVRAAGSRYSGFNFWPGPLNADGTLPNPTDCSAFDRIWVVSVADVATYDAGGTATADLRDWPVGLGAPAVTASGAPVAVSSREQTLDLAAGERPVLSGSQTAWWVMNDVGGPHSLQQSKPLGIEVRVTAYAIASEAVAGASQATVYRFEILNRSANAIEDARAGLFLDPDLGNASDDYVGTDSTRGLFFVYNSRDPDSQYGVPPAIGVDWLSGAGASSYFEGKASGPTTDPSTGLQIYQFLKGLWGDGTPMRARNNGYGQPTRFPITSFAFPGDPVTGQGWSEVNGDGMGTDNPAGDRRGQVSTPSFRLAPGASRTLDLAILFAQGGGNLDSILRLRGVSDRIQAAYDAGTLPRLGAALRTLAAPTLVSPTDGADATRADSVAFAWQPVEGASGYVFRFGTNPDDLDETEQTETANIRLSIARLSQQTGNQRVYWQVRAGGPGAIGMPSDIRSVVVFRGGVLTLASGDPAFVEVSGPGGADPCAPTASSRGGCNEVLGNGVYHSFNSTAEYYLSEVGPGSEASLGAFSPNDFEIRFTDAGGLAGYLFQAPYHVIRVPFEVWDVGTVAPGQPNDPADDVRLIPLLFADGGPAGTCAFNADEKKISTTFDGFVESDRIYDYYPATSYADFEAAFADQVDAAPGQCFPAGTQGALLNQTNGSRPIQRQVFGSAASAPVLPHTGTVVRLYTTDPQPVAGQQAPERETLALTVAPNPSRDGATVRYVLTAPATVHVQLADVLGREVAVLAAGEQTAGPHEARVPDGLAAGVYVVTVTVAGQRSARVLTVVR